MDAFTIAAPVPSEETEQIPADYDTGNGTTNYSCTIA
ncbi:mating pheromone precursor, partial [Postia placenta Mad-698-R]